MSIEVKNLSQLKKNLRVGSILESLPCIHLESGVQKKVTILQTNALAFKRYDSPKNTWMWFNKACNYIFEGDCFYEMDECSDKDYAEYKRLGIKTDGNNRCAALAYKIISF